MEGRKSMVFWTVLVVLMAGLALITPFAGRKLYTRYHRYRAESIAAQATALLKEERWEAASELLKRDFKTYGKEPSILRALGTLFLDGYQDLPMGSGILRQLMATGAASPDDLRKLAHATLKLGDTPAARRLFDSLPAAERTNREGLELLSDIQQHSGQAAEAEQTLRRALTLDPEDPRSQFRLALLDEASAFEVSKAVAAQAVWNVARRNDSLGLEAISHLCTSPSLTAAQARELLRLVEENPRAGARDRYRVLSANLRLNPLDRDKVIAAEVAKNKGVPVEQLFDFLRWLGVEKQYERIIELVKVDAALRDPDVFLVCVDALSAAERWKELLEVMQRPKVPVSNALGHFIMAECLAHLKNRVMEAAEHMEKVYASAQTSDQQTVYRTAELAEAQGLNGLAITGYGRVAEIRPDLRVGLLERTGELQQREKDVTGLLATLKRLRDLRPSNHAYLDQLNYLRLVTGEEMELAWDSVASSAQSKGTEGDGSTIPQPLLRALAALRMGDTGRVAEEVKALNQARQHLTAGQRAVMAGMAAAAGDGVEAFRIAESIPRVLLLPEEVAFLERAVR